MFDRTPVRVLAPAVNGVYRSLQTWGRPGGSPYCRNPITWHRQSRSTAGPPLYALVCRDTFEQVFDPGAAAA
jgi:hypothetical protein